MGDHTMTEPASTPPPDDHIEPAHSPPPPAYDDPAAAVEDPNKQPKFSPEEIHSFRQADRYAGTAIVMLMSSVFAVGLIIYVWIAATLR
jgi:hypothetical protein